MRAVVAQSAGDAARGVGLFSDRRRVRDTTPGEDGAAHREMH